MNTERDIKQGTVLAFVPYRLEIEGRPELGIFPLNVLFAGFGVRDGEMVTGSALYEPDLSSFRKEGQRYLMTYQNIYGGDCRLEITYEEPDGIYTGRKFVNGELVGSAFGKNWKMFFFHFTALGLAKGESCLFEQIGAGPSIH